MLSANSAPDAASPLDAAPDAAVPGVRAEYYTGYMDLDRTLVEPAIDQDWGAAAPAHFSARWTATMQAPAGSYQITSDTDDGVRVWVGDQLVIDDWNGHFVTRNQATVALTGPAALRVEYFQIDLAASARVTFAPPVM